MASQTVQAKVSTEGVQAKVSTEENVPPPGEEADVEVEVPPMDPVTRTALAESIIHRNVLWSLGAGIFPIPIVDMVLATGVQIKMLKQLSDLYERRFSEAVVKKILITLLSSVGGVGVGTAVGSSLIKLIPGVGLALGIASVPVVVGAFTYATGKVFLMHFETGGTVLDFDPHAMRAYFQQEFQQAKEQVARMQKEQQAKAS